MKKSIFIVLSIILSACSSTPTTPNTSTQTATTAPKPTDVPKPAAATIAPTTAPKPTDVPKPAAATIGKINQKMESAGIALTATKVERKKELDVISKAKPNNTFIVVDVLIENATRDKTPYNLLYFKAKDGDGYEYNAAFSAMQGQLGSGDITAGDKVRGLVAFELPEKAKGVVITYQPLVILGGYQPIRIALD